MCTHGLTCATAEGHQVALCKAQPRATNRKVGLSGSKACGQAVWTPSGSPALHGSLHHNHAHAPLAKARLGAGSLSILRETRRCVSLPALDGNTRAMVHLLPGATPTPVSPRETAGRASQPLLKEGRAPNPIPLCQRPEDSCSRKETVPHTCRKAPLCPGKSGRGVEALVLYNSRCSITPQDAQAAKAGGALWTKLLI